MKRVAISNLNASTLDILNTIRANASYEYQENIPEISDVRDIPTVGQTLYGYPALANQFINALVNRIALVVVKSATFNNLYADLKKGYLEFGETVEDVFVEMAKATEFSQEKAPAREFKRTIPDVKTAFHVMNWKVQYPITIEREDLRMAFTSAQGVQDMITKILNSVYTAVQYDEFLLFKYLMIKSISKGKMKPIGIGDGTNMKETGKVFRATSNMFEFIKTDYNESGVHTNTMKNDQYIFMDANFQADYDINVLADAFNMDKAEIKGHLKLIDDWTTFDNERFDIIRANSDMIEEVTDEELAMMQDVKAVLVDKEWFQIYDNENLMTEDFVGSGIYWNYWYNTWKTISSSPFSNAVVFVKSSAVPELPDEITIEVTQKSINENATILTLTVDEDDTTLPCKFVQSEAMTTKGIAVHPYGAIIMPANVTDEYVTVDVNGTLYVSTTKLSTTSDVGDTLTLEVPDTSE